MDSEAKDVGILAIELIFPSQYVDQAEMEQYDQVSKGKYTVGLGQQQMGFCTDKEDVYSLCLTVVSKLMERNNIPYSRIGCLQVGTETILDKSKSVKSVLMQLFEESGNKDVEGIDNVNACYGGTAALFNAVAWIESSAWDGRYALAVAGDIAVYAKGNARPTGGAGAVAMLLGPNAPLILDKGVRATYMEHAYDFYKPKLSSEYPLVDGRLSIKCYLNALDNCYKLFCQKNEQLCHNGTSGKQFNLTNLDAVIFHSPYCKLVQKSLARLVLNDFLRMPKEKQAIKYPELKHFQKRKLEDTYFDRDVEKILLDVSKDVFMEKTEPALLFAKRVGNMYTPSLYAGLVSLLISKSLQELSGKRVCLFSYGSGLASTMYSLHIASDIHPGSALYKLVNNLVHLRTLLDVRQKIHPKEFDQIMQIREMNHHKAPYTPLSSADNLFPGTWYLESIDSLYRRSYKQVP